jgi:hypothetical protein
MNEVELEINYLVSCIESINQISSLPAVGDLRQVVNKWVDEKTGEALANPATRLQIFSTWKRLLGDSDSERMVGVINSLPENDLSSEIRQLFHDRIHTQLDEAMKDPANKMLFLRSWLATEHENLNENGAPGDEVSTVTTVERADPDQVW